MNTIYTIYLSRDEEIVKFGVGNNKNDKAFKEVPPGTKTAFTKKVDGHFILFFDLKTDFKVQLDGFPHHLPKIHMPQ